MRIWYSHGTFDEFYNYSLKSRWRVVEYLPITEAARQIFWQYSPRLKRIIVLVYIHEVISTTDNLIIFKRNPIKDSYSHLNSYVEKVAKTIRKTYTYGMFKHGQCSCRTQNQHYNQAKMVLFNCSKEQAKSKINLQKIPAVETKILRLTWNENWKRWQRISTRKL